MGEIPRIPKIPWTHFWPNATETRFDKLVLICPLYLTVNLELSLPKRGPKEKPLCYLLCEKFVGMVKRFKDVLLVNDWKAMYEKKCHRQQIHLFLRLFWDMLQISITQHWEIYDTFKLVYIFCCVVLAIAKYHMERFTCRKWINFGL